MQRTNVYINRTLCDFEEIEGLPIQLTVAVDKFLDVDSRLTGAKLDGGLKQLALPATKNNSAILSQLWEIGSNTDATLDIIIDVDGQPVFAGKCKPTETIRSWTAPKQYFLELYGWIRYVPAGIQDLNGRLSNQGLSTVLKIWLPL